MNYTFKTKLILAILAAALLHGLYNFLIPLHPDEAYYWLWSRHIDWSYYDHPGMVAWLIRIFSFLGSSEAAVRLTTVFCMSGAAYALCMLAYHIAGEKAGWINFIVFSILPATAMGYTFVTPDSPLILFWCSALYSGYLAVQGHGKRYFLLTGFFIACMITSKYTAVLFPASLFVYMLLFDRRLFRDKYTWIACVIALCGVIPILIWNIQHDWISIRFQYEHGTSETFRILWGEFFILLLGIQLLPTPFFAFIIYKAAFYFKGYRRDGWWRYLLIFFLVPTLFFLYKGLFKKMELNWPILGYLAALPMMAVYVAQGYSKKLFRTGAYFAGALTLILLISPFIPLPDRINISLRLTGNREAIRGLEKAADRQGDYFSHHLSTASMMSYYLKGHPRVYIPVPSRFSQFDIWDNGTDYSVMEGYYLGTDKKIYLQEKFKNVELLETVATESPVNPKYLYIYWVDNE